MTLLFTSSFRKTSGWSDVTLNAKTNGNRWQQGLGSELDGPKLPS
jgi:hypothetical protein